MLTQREVVELVLRAARPPPPRSCRSRSRALRAAPARPTRRSPGPTALLTWDEARLLAVTMLTARGTADAEALGVSPRRMADVLAPRRSAARPGRAAARGLHLRGDLQQRVLAERLADELHAGRQAVGAEADRHRDRRLAGDVEQRACTA